MNGQNAQFLPQMSVATRTLSGQQSQQQQQTSHLIQPATQYILQTGPYVTTGATIAVSTTNINEMECQQQLVYGGQLYSAGKTEPLNKNVGSKQAHKAIANNTFMITQDRFDQMQQQYERRIELLEQEIKQLKQQLQPGKNTRYNRSTNINNNNTASVSPHIVETYHEDLQTRVFACKNCSYKAKSEAALVIHNTNHLVSQRYLHLPTTVFTVKIDSQTEVTTNPNIFLYPCGECNGKFTKNKLYLHIYEVS